MGDNYSGSIIHSKMTLDQQIKFYGKIQWLAVDEKKKFVKSTIVIVHINFFR